MSAFYEIVLDHLLRATLRVEFTTVSGAIRDYSIVLIHTTGDGAKTIRVYDAAHGFNEMHRYTRSGGKQAGVRFHPGTLGEGMRDAIAAVEASYPEMIEGWRSR